MTGANLPTSSPPPESEPAAAPDLVEFAEDVERGQIRIIAGPFPGPGMLKGYQDVDRTFPDRLMRIAEAYAAQRLRAEDKRVDAEVYVEKKTPLLLAVIILGVLAVIAFAIYRGMSGPAIAAMLTALGGVIGVAHLRRLMSRDKREGREYETVEPGDSAGEHFEVDATGERSRPSSTT
jgi:hypothetical protein